MKADETHLQLAADAVEETMRRFTANGIDRGALVMACARACGNDLLAQSRHAKCCKALKMRASCPTGACTAQFSLADLATEFREQDRMLASIYGCFYKH
jgi:hypothetical protein